MIRPRPTRKIKPATAGALVPFPGHARRMLKAEGEVVAWSAWWAKRLHRGEVVEIVDAPTEDPKASKAKTPKG